jgi:predicted N-acetyltransferase YhbS
MSAGTETGGSLLLRAGTPADAPELGRICYEAFRTIAETHRYPPDFASPAVAAGLLESFLAHPAFFPVVAEEDGRIVGSNFMDERNAVFGVGPITVTPDTQNRGVGRKLMEAVLHRAEERCAPGTRLVQAGYHMRSLALYTKLGYDPRETMACLQGPIPSSRVAGRTVRPARDSDLVTCAALCRHVLGFDRRGELEDAIRAGTATVVEVDGRVTGYSTAVAFFGHQVGEANEDVEALIQRAPEIAGPGILVPLRNAELLRWALTSGLRIVQTMTLMSTGEYQPPAGPYVASIFY